MLTSERREPVICVDTGSIAPQVFTALCREWRRRKHTTREIQADLSALAGVKVSDQWISRLLSTETIHSWTAIRYLLGRLSARVDLGAADVAIVYTCEHHERAQEGAVNA